MDIDEELPLAYLELCYLDKSTSPPAITVENPVWESIEVGIGRVFVSGGFLRVSVMAPKSSFVRELSMKSLPGKFRLAVLTRSDNPREEYLEWWELSDSPYRGVTRIGDDDWDSRTVCSDISIAEEIFKELYEKGDLEMGLAQMRSPWNPKP
jgi:hypothetical protein